MVNENLVSYFPARVYNGIDDFAENIMNPATCHSSTVNLSTKDNFNFIQPEYYQTKFGCRFLCVTTNFFALPVEHRVS